MNKPKPSLVRIIQSDYIAMLGVLAPVVFLAGYIAIAYFGFLPGFRGHDPIQGTEGAPFFLYGFIVTLVLGIPAVIWRFKTIQNVFANGTEVPGKIEEVYFRRDRGNVVYRYEYQGKAYSGANAIMKNSRTQSLAPGREIALIVSKDDPGRALIRDLYI
jgi:hypothetical protein